MACDLPITVIGYANNEEVFGGIDRPGVTERAGYRISGDQFVNRSRDFDVPEWRRVEPQIMRIIAQGPADADGQTFTPVRTGDEKLRLEYKRLTGDAPAERSVTYDVSVPEATGIFSRFWARLRGKSSS